MSNGRSIFDVLRHVANSLQEAQRDGRDRAGGAGHISGPRGRTDYGFSARIGPGTEETETTASADHDHLVDVRRGEDHLLVVADLPDVDADDLTVGIDRGAGDLVVGVDDTPVEHVPLPWPDADVDARFEHGVLEVHIEPAGAGSHP